MSFVPSEVQIVKNPNKQIIYPTCPLNEEKLDQVLSELRRALNAKKLNYYEAFRILDANKDGFITYDEFNKHLNAIYEFSQQIKDALFASFDN